MSGDHQKLFEERRARSRAKLQELREAVEKIDVLTTMHGLCIYATGSYGRFEASAESDIDLFFLHAGTRAKNKLPWLGKTRMDAQLIDIVADLGFPPFSNDGEYLQVHYLNDMIAGMGGREDDSLNHFTARMLLLLESQWIHNEAAYNNTKEKIAHIYCRDFHDKDSRNAFFVINDILRYWRTMCVNYEHPRNEEDTDAAKVNKARLRNIKLKFSRKLICFSMVAPLVRGGQKLKSEELLRLMELPPMARLEKAAAAINGGDELVERLKENYAWFMTQTGKEKNEVLRWISDKGEYANAREHAGKFSDILYQLIKASAGENTEMMRYLVL